MLGQSAAFSGPAAQLGIQMNAGARIYFNALNSQGGVHGRSAASDFGKLVVKAPTAKTLEERAALYAELLVTCGGCHRAINEAGSK